MLRKILIIAVFCSFAFGASAQNGNGLGGGVRVGVNMADLTKSTGRIRAGLSAGLFVDYTIKRFGFEAGLYYSEQGSFNVAEQSIAGNRADYKLDYLDLQLIAKYQVFNGFRVFLGPNAGYVVAARRSYANITEGISNITPWDVGVVGGVGYTFRFGLDVAASYTHGFIDVFQDSRTSYTSMFKVTVGWNFLRKKNK
ncbi:MAG: porin family protein [Mucinivorans sp.]